MVLFDIVDGVPGGKGLDIAQAGAIEGYDAAIKPANAYAEIEGADVIIVAAGMPRKPGMSRDDLLGINKGIVSAVALEVSERSPDAIMIVVTNPLDAMCHAALDASRVPAPARDRHGRHPRHRPLPRVPGGRAQGLGRGRDGPGAGRARRRDGADRPLLDGRRRIGLPDLVKMGWLKQERLDAIVDRTRKGGGEIVNLLDQGSAFYAPASSAIQMAESYIKDKRRVLPCAAYLSGEYGVRGLYVEAVKAAQQLPGPIFVVKAQIHAGGRGKGKFKERDAGERGGVRLAKSAAEVRALAGQMLGAPWSRCRPGRTAASSSASLSRTASRSSASFISRRGRPRHLARRLHRLHRGRHEYRGGRARDARRRSHRHDRSGDRLSAVPRPPDRAALGLRLAARAPATNWSARFRPSSAKT